MATRDDVLQYGVNNADLLVGAGIILIQSSTNWDITGFSATAFPAKLGDIIDLSGTTIGRAKSENGWRNMGHTDGLKPMDRARETQTLGSDQVPEVRTTSIKWTHKVTGTLLETNATNLNDLFTAHPSGVQTVSGDVPTEYRLSLGAPAGIKYHRIAVLHPDVEGRLWGYVYAMSEIHGTGGPTFNPSDKHGWPFEALCYPDSRIADVNDRVLRVYYTDKNFFTQ